MVGLHDGRTRAGSTAGNRKGLADESMAEPRMDTRSTEKTRTKDRRNSSIADTKTKGFDGVDFSYDLFGAPPGQDAYQIAEEVQAKDIAEKPKVMAKQKQLLRDRYSLDCKTQSGATIQKGNPSRSARPCN